MKQDIAELRLLLTKSQSTVADTHSSAADDRSDVTRVAASSVEGCESIPDASGSVDMQAEMRTADPGRPLDPQIADEVTTLKRRLHHLESTLGAQPHEKKLANV